MTGEVILEVKLGEWFPRPLTITRPVKFPFAIRDPRGPGELLIIYVAGFGARNTDSVNPNVMDLEPSFDGQDYHVYVT